MAARTGTEKKSDNVIILDMREVTLVADYFVILSGSSRPQVKAIVDHIEKQLEMTGARPLRCEGYAAARWVLLDYGGVVVHVFHEQDRAFYALERLWGDAPARRLDGEATAGTAGGQ